MLARLTVHFPFQPTRSFVVRGDAAAVIGRDPACDIVLEDDRVSRRHARLTFIEGAWRLADLESTNGTSLGGAPLGEVSLGTESWISFGGLLARFEPMTAEREAAELKRREARWRSSISHQKELTPALGLEPLLERVLDSVLELSSTDRGFVLFRGDDGVMEIAARRNVVDPDLEDGTFAGSVGAVERVLESGRAVAVSDAMADPELQDRTSVIAHRIRGLVCVPLVAGERLIGLVYADSREAGASFSDLDVEILESLATHAGLALAMARVDREIRGLAARLPRAEPATRWRSVVAHHASQPGARP